MALLTAHVLNGKRVGVDIPVNSIIEIPFKIEEEPSLGYADISSVENWWKFGITLKDYLFVRKKIKELIIEKGIQDTDETRSSPPSLPVEGKKYYINHDEIATDEWTGYEGWVASWNILERVWKFEPAEWVGYRVCSTSEKDIAAQLKIGSQGDHFADYGVPAIVDYGFDYHKKSRSTREERMLRTTVEVYNLLPLNVAEALGDITNSPLGDMYSRYIEFGVKGTVEDYNKDFNPNPTPGICDWVLGRAPFIDEAPYNVAGYPNGLIDKDWQPIDGTTIQYFANKIFNILVNGV